MSCSCFVWPVCIFFSVFKLQKLISLAKWLLRLSFFGIKTGTVVPNPSCPLCIFEVSGNVVLSLIFSSSGLECQIYGYFKVMLWWNMRIILSWHCRVLLASITVLCSCCPWSKHWGMFLGALLMEEKHLSSQSLSVLTPWEILIPV